MPQNKKDTFQGVFRFTPTKKVSIFVRFSLKYRVIDLLKVSYNKITHGYFTPL